MPARLAVVQPAGAALQLRQKAAHAAAAHLVDHVVPEHAAGICQSAFRREQQQARVLQRRRRQDHVFARPRPRSLPGEAFDVRDALRAVLVVHAHAAPRRNPCGTSRLPVFNAGGSVTATVLNMAPHRSRSRSCRSSGRAAGCCACASTAPGGDEWNASRGSWQAAVKMDSAQLSGMGGKKHAIGKLRHAFDRAAHADESIPRGRSMASSSA